MAGGGSLLLWSPYVRVWLLLTMDTLLFDFWGVGCPSLRALECQGRARKGGFPPSPFEQCQYQPGLVPSLPRGTASCFHPSGSSLNSGWAPFSGESCSIHFDKMQSVVK